MTDLIDISLSMGMNWENTSYVHEAVWNVIQCVTDKELNSDKVSMVSTELTENALKYGDQDYRGNDAILFSLKGNKEEVVIEVINRTIEQQESNVKDLDSTIQWVRGFQSPYEAYIECLKRTSKRRNSASKLGIARIAYEGGAIVDFYLNDDNQVAVSAIIKLEN